MRKILLFFLCAMFVSNLSAQELKPIQLKKPDTKKGLPIMQTLEKRQSIREYADKKLSEQDLSDLLWAANGINRPESGKRTAPSAMNVQEVDVYVCLPDGAYLYDAKANMLKPVVKGDLRPMVAGPQAGIAKAPVCLVLVTDVAKYTKRGDQVLTMATIDVGIVSQNISLFCAGTGLATVPRAYMEKDKLKEALKIKETQHILLNHPVGYPK